MTRRLALVLFLLGCEPVCALAAPVESLFVQVAPGDRPRLAPNWGRRPGEKRAVVLIQGLKVQPFGSDSPDRASLREWQQPGSVVVRALAMVADVYAFGYAQNVHVEDIANLVSLQDGIRSLRDLGYTEVVLVGYSAGGLVARELIENHPDLGVTKVIQLCAPNSGSGLATLDRLPGVRKPFIRSLSKSERRAILSSRGEVRIPEAIEFVCVVGTLGVTGDGVVSIRSGWSEDLQAQGIPVVAWTVDHLSAVRTPASALKLAELVHQPQPRWTPTQVAAARKALLGVWPSTWTLTGRDKKEGSRSPPLKPTPMVPQGLLDRAPPSISPGR